MSNTQIKLYGPFTQLVSLKNLPLKGSLKDDQIDIIKNAGIIAHGSKIQAVGDFEKLNAQLKGKNFETEYIQEPTVVVPGFIDAHTHICFDGNRAADFASRNAGISYQEIAAAGGGIWSSVTHTRNATKKRLVSLMNKRIQQLILNGITTVEIKSGYGLSVEHEIKMLQAIAEVKKKSKINVVPTCLAAHIKPKDFDGDERAYLDMILNDLVPLVKNEDLTNRFDIFTEENAFSIEGSKYYLKALKQKGFDLTIHGDQFSVGGSKVAVECGALSVDHLEVSGKTEIEMIAKSETIAMALPGASLGIGCDFTPARKLLDAGASVAIASDWNPGSAPMGYLLNQASILATFEKLSTAEVLAGMTFRAAKALNYTDRGVLEKGKRADFQMFPTQDYRDILYHQGSLRPSGVWCGGKRIR